MAKNNVLSRLVNGVAWLTGVLVSLAVGFGMIGGTLSVPWLTDLGLGILAVIAGWVVVILTIVGIILAIFNR